MTDERNNFSVNVAEYLGVQPARLTNVESKPPVALLTLRLIPAESWECRNVALTQRQCIRLRDDLNLLLTDRTSWLYTEDALEVREEAPVEIEIEREL